HPRCGHDAPAVVHDIVGTRAAISDQPVRFAFAPGADARCLKTSRAADLAEGEIGGERGIRTPGPLSKPTVFKTAALNHSAISPRGGRGQRPAAPSANP